MGGDPSINWGDVSGGFDKSVDASKDALASAEVNKQYWQNQDVLWASMYGNIESNVAGYYDSLTADNTTAERNQKVISQFTAAKERTLQQLQDRGFSSSGAVAQVLANSNSQQAIAMANNAYESNKDVWQQKAAFMQGIALPQKQNVQSNITNAQGNISNAYGNLASTELNRANAFMGVKQFNESHSNDQLNAGLGMVSSLGGAYLGGGFKPGGTMQYPDYSKLGNVQTTQVGFTPALQYATSNYDPNAPEF